MSTISTPSETSQPSKLPENSGTPEISNGTEPHALNAFIHSLSIALASFIVHTETNRDDITLEILPEHIISVCRILRDHEHFKFEMLMDLCVVDYLEYGVSDWKTTRATDTSFSRGVYEQPHCVWNKPRFAVVYHLLSLHYNQRLRLKVFLADPTSSNRYELPRIPSVIDIWNSANWYEREAFDLFGILFEGHPDLRRILTDYGFIGHPFRKDFPLIGTVEMRYSAQDKRVIYQPVTIPPRTLVPKTIPTDNRYINPSSDLPSQNQSKKNDGVLV